MHFQYILTHDNENHTKFLKTMCGIKYCYWGRSYKYQTRLVTSSFLLVLSVHLSSWTDFDEICYWELLRKPFVKFQILLKSDNSVTDFT